MQRYSDRSLARSYPADGALEVVVDRVRARYGAWYELFPRSCGASDHVHGTFADVIARLPYVAQMGFDVLYLPPIHPIGRVHRKGKNNAEEAEPGDVGSPWAIGASEGGHKAIHPQLGTLEDFQRLLSEAKKHHLELAMDVAFQCAPDHPYVAEHPEWFKVRPDGSIQYAENPPKKYQDIFPFDFETPRWRELWEELRSVVQYWVDQGVRIFRVDNPHTKPFAFWEWLIAEIRRDHPETIFLAEAFARPRVMQALAKLGFTQSYTYFTWRNTKQELTQYFTALTESEQREYFRPSAWPNTPDILPEFLQIGGREAFRLRVVLAATLSANYGIYGPSFELGDNRPRTPGGEEYLDSEKYQLRHWTLDEPMSLAPFIGRLNRIRRDNAALQTNVGLTFHNTDNEYLLCYSKRSDDGENTVLVVVNLDPHHTHSGWIDVSPTTFGLPQERTSQLHDLLTEARYFWQGERLFVELNPQLTPAHLFRMRRWVRTEHDFDYFM